MKKILKIAQQICKLQGINMNIQVVVNCPRCDSRTMIIDQDGQGHCRCGYNADILEILDLAELEWLEQHKESRKNMGCD